MAISLADPERIELTAARHKPEAYRRAGGQRAAGAANQDRRPGLPGQRLRVSWRARAQPGTCESSHSAMKLTFKIKHLMYLTLWTALILAAREPLTIAAPELVSLVVWVSGIAAVGIFVGLYGIAALVDEGDPKDQLVNKLCYFLIGDGILFFLFLVAETRLKGG
jgi:hypothetical protein